MKRWIAFIILSAITVESSYCQINTVALAKSAKTAVVTIDCYDKDHFQYGFGTGFFISPTRLVTNRHVVENAMQAKCLLSDSSETQIDGIVAEDKQYDIVILECKSAALHHIHPLKLATDLPDEGEEIVVVGSPLGYGHSISQGIISSIRKNGSVIQFTAPVSEGSSGSPVINAKGQVVGIAFSIIRNAENLNFAVPSSRVVQLKIGPLIPLTDWNRNQDAPPPLVRLLPKTKQAETQADSFKRARIGNYAYGRGADCMDEKKYNEAIEMFDLAVNQVPESADAWFALGNALGYETRYDEATVALEHAVKLRPDFPEAWLYLGEAYSFSDAGKAEDAFIKAENDKDFGPTALFGLGKLYHKQQRYQKAAEALEACAKLYASDADIFGLLGNSYIKLKQYPEARTADKMALSIDPNFRNALLDLSLADAQMQKFDEGVSYLESALKHTPDDQEILGNLGGYYVDMNRFAEAIKVLKRAETLAPKNPDIHQNLAMAFIRSGDKPGALKELETLRKLDPKKAKDLEEYIARH